ncbi:MAG: GGDEF domain-containing protein [Gammaproteobacteria bacterium]|nr:GGDEF domain-containing protein [Gammaproteobacteria bacterium]
MKNNSIFKYQKSLFLGLSLCSIVITLNGYFLYFSYEQSKRSAEDRISRTSYLIEEWVKGAFKQSDYVLRDIISAVDVDELQLPTLDAEKHERRNNWLVKKRSTITNASLVALYDKNCVITHSPGNPKAKGFDASSRDYCHKFKSSPSLDTWVTSAYVPKGKKQLHAAQFRRFSSTSSELEGLVGFALNLNFFNEWVTRLKVPPNGLIGIFDTNSNLLAFRSNDSEKTSLKVNDLILEKLQSIHTRHTLIHQVDLSDDKKRLVSYRKINELPFIVVVGEADMDWLSDWKIQIWISLVSLLIICYLIIINATEHDKVLRQRDLLSKAANTDSLTNLINRRHFNELAIREIQRARRTNRPLGIVMLDIDYFKNINDTHGHAIGDQALIAFANACCATLRNIDIVARFAGDEFIVLLPEISQNNLLEIIERLRLAISEIKLNVGNDKELRMTTSIGISWAIGNGVPKLDEFILQADNQLYLAKQQGRNKVVMHD